MDDGDFSMKSLRGATESPPRESVQTQKLQTERGWMPDRSLQVWRRGTLLTILRTAEMREKLERTCFSRTQKSPDRAKRHSLESKSESVTPKPVPAQRRKEEVFLHSNEGLLCRLREMKKREVQRRMAQQGEREIEAKTMRLDRECEAEEHSFSQLTNITEKLLRSTVSHKAFLQTRAWTVARNRKAPKQQHSPDLETNRLEEYLTRAISEEKRVSRVKEGLCKSAEELKKKRMERHKKVETNLKLTESKLEAKLRRVAKRQEEVDEAVESRIAEQLRTHQQWQESLREKEEHANYLIDKARQEQADRASRLLDKLSDSLHRVERLKQERNCTVEKRRDDLRTRMLAKERHIAVLETLSKSPTVRRARKMLRALGSNANNP